ncbi:MAG: S-layer homology domain-containing protein [Evtepia gabavorous]
MKVKRRVCSAALTLAMTLSLLVTMVLPAGAVDYAGGSGTRNDPYLIATAQQLKNFRDQVNAGDRDLCASLITNVDLAGQDWDPIGLSSSGYVGTFEGNGYAIRNLKISRLSAGTSTGAAPLGAGCSASWARAAWSGGSMWTHHLHQDTVSHHPDIGAIAGGNLGTIEECFATVTLRDFHLTVDSSSQSGRVNIGGIAGANAGTIRNCYVVGSMDATVTFARTDRELNMGGLVGQTYQSGATLENGYSAVTIRANTNGRAQIGGLLGHLDASGTYRSLHANGDLCTALLGSGSASRLTGCTLLGTGAMKQASFAAQLGSAFAADTQKVNHGYHILQVMAYDEESGWSEWFEDEAMGDNINQEIFDSLIPAELQNRDLTRDITRAEFCAVSVRLYEQMGGQKLDAAALDSPFADTGSDAVKKAYALGITNGVSPTAFAPYTHISREQLATMLTRVYKALNLPGWTLATDDQYTLDYSGTTPFADDGDISAYAKPSVYFMVKNQVIKGTSPTTFSPRNVTAAQEAIGYANASREQALIMAVRMFQKL